MLKKVKWKNHDSLGDLELDFTKKDGSVYNTIIFAGDNGSGKTTILDTISSFINLGSISVFEYIEYEISGVNYKLEPNTTGGENGFHKRINLDNGNETQVNINRINGFKKLEKDKEDIRHYGLLYSKAKSGFKTNQIRASTAQQIDSNKYDIDESDDYTPIKQFLVDMKTQDNELLSKRVSENIGLSPEQFDLFTKESKIFRFEKAFNDFFSDLKFYSVESNNSNEINVFFKKHDRVICIDQLSTGEKQIVFRGTNLLKNSGVIFGGFVFIDEPELSMHPKWQKKILKFYRDLFSSNETQTVQMFIATHSTYVIESALEHKDDVLVYVLSDNNGKIETRKVTSPGFLPNITSAEINYMVFSLPSIDYHIELYGWLQRKNNDLSVKDCDNYIKKHTQYNQSKHGLYSSYIDKKGNLHEYYTLPTYIRNAIDHPDPSKTFSESQLQISIELLQKLL